MTARAVLKKFIEFHGVLGKIVAACLRSIRGIRYLGESNKPRQI